MPDLFDPVEIGPLTLKNRIFMPPMTRSRADESGVQGPHAAEYYAQRASAGLIIAEAAQISAQGKGYINTPGIYSDEQIAAWRAITDAVHAKGGAIFCQLWHVGRISHVSLLPEGKQPVAPSAIRAEAQTFVAEGMADVSEPRALEVNEIKAIVQEYKHAAQAAKDAGFDGIEIHAANGYLIDQFIRDKTNRRDDEYGGTPENRARFLFEVFDAVREIWEPGLIGARFAPTITFNDIEDSTPLETFGYIYEALDRRGAGYIHVCEGAPGMAPAAEGDDKILAALRKKWSGFYMVNGGFDLDVGQDVIASGYADAVSYGRPFIANPDLPKRFESGEALNMPDESTFYGGDHHGYTDYPFLKDKAA
ncbi:MAG: alkene reductase [Pseudomonadota bacterium]